MFEFLRWIFNWNVGCLFHKQIKLRTKTIVEVILMLLGNIVFFCVCAGTAIAIAYEARN